MRRRFREHCRPLPTWPHLGLQGRFCSVTPYGRTTWPQWAHCTPSKGNLLKLRVSSLSQCRVSSNTAPLCVCILPMRVVLSLDSWRQSTGSACAQLVSPDTFLRPPFMIPAIPIHIARSLSRRLGLGARVLGQSCFQLELLETSASTRTERNAKHVRLQACPSGLSFRPNSTSGDRRCEGNENNKHKRRTWRWRLRWQMRCCDVCNRAGHDDTVN